MTWRAGQIEDDPWMTEHAMPYAITPNDASVQAAVRRITREEASHALESIHAPGELGSRVHEMRKTVEKLRGLLRLVRPVFRDAAAENLRLGNGKGQADGSYRYNSPAHVKVALTHLKTTDGVTA